MQTVLSTSRASKDFRTRQPNGISIFKGYLAAHRIQNILQVLRYLRHLHRVNSSTQVSIIIPRTGFNMTMLLCVVMSGEIVNSLATATASSDFPNKAFIIEIELGSAHHCGTGR